MQVVDALACLAEEGRIRPRKTSGSCQESFDPAVSEWGNPTLVMQSNSSIYTGKATWGTEISKYPEEKKSKEIPLVSDERTGISSNLDLSGGCRTLTLDC